MRGLVGLEQDAGMHLGSGWSSTAAGQVGEAGTVSLGQEDAIGLVCHDCLQAGEQDDHWSSL